MTDLLAISDALSTRLSALEFGPPVASVYNPLEYAGAPWAEYLRRFGSARERVVLVGMNPGPFGMAQTGVPFGDVVAVRDWMGIVGPVGAPPRPHPKRPVEGFDLRRREGSGKRLWGWAEARFGTAESFFERFFVLNYCPLLFLHESGRNLTPVDLRAGDTVALFEACDDALRRAVDALAPSAVVGVGVFAEARAREALGGAVRIGRVLHPSPASPAANRGWSEAAEAALAELVPELAPVFAG
ncbi:MAG: single-stranded DNA-binding protein [Myxococcales bacterium]|nr:single-stranded DNA-binding protein [Myxococcales bacterium]MCB9519506.1 single-stranded DNA-binding protein [Myxococcales bacterium]MCB9533269.1 single-stranded DNA-binding protein [Myxococcales bacterium]